MKRPASGEKKLERTFAGVKGSEIDSQHTIAGFPRNWNQIPALTDFMVVQNRIAGCFAYSAAPATADILACCRIECEESNA
jgi:hypothetical protein